MSAESVMVREGWTLVQTCVSCPEQYEVVDHQGEVKAYLRLRWGHFEVTCPDVAGQTVFSHTWEGDLYKGAFDTDEERRTMLAAAVDAADDWWRAA